MNRAINHLVKQGLGFTDVATDRARSSSKRGIKAVGSAAQRALDSASSARGSVLSYTKASPTKALLIAAVSGAVLMTLATFFTPSRK